jgi:hypothetical protein
MQNIWKLSRKSTALEIYEEYLVQREKYLQTPSFYFDVAQLLFEKISKIGFESFELYRRFRHRK